MGKEHLGVAQHREHLDRGDREGADRPLAALVGHRAEQPRCLHRRLKEQAPGQGLVAHGGDREAGQIHQQPPLDQPGGFPPAGAHRTGQGPAAADHQPALPQAPGQQQEGEGGEGESGAQAHRPLGIGGHPGADAVEQQNPHHHHREGQLGPEAHPAHIAEGAGDALQIHWIGHGTCCPQRFQTCHGRIATASAWPEIPCRSRCTPRTRPCAPPPLLWGVSMVCIAAIAG